MNFSLSAIAAGFIYGVIGMYMLKRAKTEAHVPSFVIGMALMIYPYFIENIYLLWGIGAALLFVAYKLARA